MGEGNNDAGTSAGTSISPATHPLAELSPLYDGPRPGGFIHVMNIASVPESQARIGDHVAVRRATEFEVRAIRRLHRWHGLFVGGFGQRNPFETKVERHGPDPKARDHSLVVSSYTTEGLPPDDHVYWVVEHTSVGIDVYQVQWASALTPWLFEYGASMRFHQSVGCGVHEDDVRRFAGFADLEPEPFVHLDAAAIDELNYVFRKWTQHEFAVVDLESSVRKYLRIRALPNLELRVLGYFALLESLITHKPSPSDPTEALGRQIRSKILLLGNRFKRPLPYGELTDGTTAPSKVWSALYEYRSNLAHGSVSNFQTKPLQCLRTPGKAETLVQLALVAVMRQALEEPRLVVDLKEC